MLDAGLAEKDHEKGDTTASISRHESRTVAQEPADFADGAYNPPSPAELNTTVFAGRLGGGQRYALTPTGAPIGEESPDAYRDASWSAILSLRSITKPTLWKMAIIEGIATCMQVLLSGYLGIGLVPTVSKVSVGPVFPVAMASVAQVFLVGLFVWSLGPLTGGHLNPLITLGTLGARLCSLPRALLYVSFQCIGAIIAGWILRAALGTGAQALAVIPGCYVDPTMVTPGEAYAFEASTAFFAIFLSFGLGLDPRVESSCGSTLAPLLIGITSALTIYCTGFTKPGYLGAATNPARCLGLMTAANRFDYHYIHWLGDLTAVACNSLLYALLPPYALQR